MGNWTALLGTKRTNEELSKIRAEVAKRFDIEAFTCDGCIARHTCEYAFDAYNTDEDCLAEK